MTKKYTYINSKEIVQKLKTVSNANILFAHHSVGNNIIDGLQQITDEYLYTIHIHELKNINTSINHPAIVHFSPGINGSPKKKIDDFATAVKENQRRLNTQIAFIKFCYIDFIPETKFEDIFNYYKKTITELEYNYPNIAFIHFTVPLTTKSSTFKDRLKRFFGFRPWGDSSNLIRQKYNNLLLKSFPDKQIFDIAKIESTHPNGTRETIQHDEQTIYSLASEYSDDGAHLNSFAQKIVALKLIVAIDNNLGIKTK